VKTVAPFALFAAFIAIFWWQSRRAGMPMNEWLRQRNRAQLARPGWWRPLAVWVAFLMILFIVVATAQHGWRWQYLLVLPIIGGTAALMFAFMSWLLRRL
jgi:hypothetical protein